MLYFFAMNRFLQKVKLTRLVNIALRGMTLVCKFALIIFLARFLDPAELGLYGLLAASVGYALYLVGLDFYTFTTREIIKNKAGDWGRVLKSQIALSVISYSIFTPILLVFFIGGLLPYHLLGWFFVLLIVEHVGQELNRVLVALSEQLLASVVLFVRSGMWVLLALIAMLYTPEARSVEFVFLCWSIGGGVACLLSISRLKYIGLRGWSNPVDWKSVKSGILISMPLLLSTLAVRGVLTLDRYWIEHTANLEVLGAYVLFVGVAGALLSFLDAGVFVFIYPALIAAHNSKDAASFRLHMLKMTKQSLVIGGLFSLAAVGLMPAALSFLDKAFYATQEWMFPWLMLAIFIYCMGMIPQYGLYAQGEDRHIILSHVSGLVVFIATAFILSAYLPKMAVIVGLLASFAISTLWKTIAYFKLSPANYNFMKNRGA